MKKIGTFAVILAAALMSNPLSAIAASETETASSLYSLFSNPDAASKPMARFWLPDAAETYEQIEREFTELYNAGFGGVEIAFFPAITTFDNTVDGWATENWRTCMKNMLKAAASFEKPFQVDFTISPGWPVALNTVDPNSQSADVELASAFQKITDSSAIMDVPMPAIVTKDFIGNPFIFKNTLVKSIIGQVTEVREDGTVVLDPDTVKSVETTATEKTTPAGIPDVASLAEDSAEYQYILELYENEIPDTSVYFTDSSGNPSSVRTALADTQNYYQADLSDTALENYTASEGTELAPGDYVIYGFYVKGNGETTQKMGLWAPYEDATPGVAYDTSPFSTASADEIISYLDKNVFCDEELTALMKKASAAIGGSIFEDSLENSYKPEIPWSYEYLEVFEEEMGYDISPYLPFISGTAAAADQSQDKYITDYKSVLSRMYVDRHINAIQSYINEKTGYSYRAQGYLTPKNEIILDTSAASAAADFAEGESLAFGANYDNYRYITGGVHIAGKNQISSESFAIQDGSSYNLAWDRVVKIMNGEFAAGVNKIIFHGTSADVSNANSGETAFSNAWPGWSAFISICTDDWDARMPYWEDMNILTDYISRNQSILLNGLPKTDLLVYDLNGYDPWSRVENGDCSAFHSLLDMGYSYDNVMTDGLLLERLKAENGVLCASGPAYKALLVNHLDAASTEVLEKILSFAKENVPVIFYGELPDTSSTARNTDNEVSELLEEIMSTGNASFAESQAEIHRELVRKNILPEASYIKENLRTITREDIDGSRYYYLFNNSPEAVDTEIDLKGNGNLYLLNAWDGSAALANASADADSVHASIHLDGYDTVIALVTENFEGGEVKTMDRSIAAQEPVSLDTWNLTIESWGPEPDTEEQYDTRKTAINIGETTLTSWENLTAPAEALSETGAASMADVSGIGTYTTEVEITGATGAYLTLEHGCDMVTSILINGQEITDLNPLTGTYDLGNVLVEGKNTIEIKLSTTLINRTRVENTLFENSAQRSYGITSATLTPYTL